LLLLDKVIPDQKIVHGQELLLGQSLVVDFANKGLEGRRAGQGCLGLLQGHVLEELLRVVEELGGLVHQRLVATAH